jgi:uncharacterized phage-like protein YoqJ
MGTMNPFLPFNDPSQITSSYRNRIVVGTGHRPAKLEDGYSELTRTILMGVATDWLRYLAPRGVLSGLALGWDSALVEACLALGIPYVACIPFEGQEKKWPGKAQFRYNEYRAKAARVIVCSPGEYSARKMHERNKRMIDLSLKDGPENALVLALWSGDKGGTQNCLEYAQRKGVEVMNCWNHYLTFTKK